MFNFPTFTIWSLWLIMVPIFAFAWAIMTIGDKLRGVKIEDVDHLNKKTTLLSMIPIVALLVLTVFTPIVTTPLFWAGCILNLVAAVTYVFSIAAFVRARRGITTIGIYRFSRNPMYISLIFILTGFSFMAFSASVLMGLLTVIVALWNIAVIHWMMLGEERFLEGKYGETYIAYKKSVPRYFRFIFPYRSHSRSSWL